MKLSDDKTLASLNITGDLDASGLDALLRKLALLRADMTPPVPNTQKELLEQDANVLIEDKPALVIAARSGGGYRIWMRHRGFGWLAYQIDDRTAASMASFIGKRIQADPLKLVDGGDGNLH